ncbi:MAG: TldD/PmbA family protein [Spirochaetia bacterium]|nr:TldD/PmbA family protein [Spirochaetia bacterium]
MLLDEALELAKKEAQKQNAAFDAVAVDKKDIGLEIFRGKVIQSEVAQSMGIGVRIYKNKKIGYSYTEKITPEKITETVNDAVENAKLSDNVEIEIPFFEETTAGTLNLYNQELDNVNFDTLKDIGLSLEQKAYGTDKLITNIPHLGLVKLKKRKLFINSENMKFDYIENMVSAGLSVFAEKNESAKSGYYVRGGRNINVFDTDLMAKEAANRAISLLGAKPVKSGQYPVVLSNRTASRLFSMFLSSFYAENAQKGQSKISGKTGKEIAAKTCNLISDPHIEEGASSRLIDDEGIPTKPIYLVKDGVLNSFLYHLESAAKENKKSSGHAQRGYSSQVTTTCWNVLLEKQNSTIDNLLNANAKCIYITELEGGAGCSQISGEISIGAQGFYIENGEKVHPVDEITLNTNFFDLLKNIESISNNYDDSFSSVKIPDLLIKEIFVAG